MRGAVRLSGVLSTALTARSALAWPGGPEIDEVAEPESAVAVGRGEAWIAAGLGDGLAGDARDAGEVPEGDPEVWVERSGDRFGPRFVLGCFVRRPELVEVGGPVNVTAAAAADSQRMVLHLGCDRSRRHSRVPAQGGYGADLAPAAR